MEYKYVKPEHEGYKLVSVKRFWLKNVYTYSKSTGFEINKIAWIETRNPNWLSKILALVLFPVSILITGAPQAWIDTYQHIWDRKYGSFIEHNWWTD
jgi:hypothetical protein